MRDCRFPISQYRSWFVDGVEDRLEILCAIYVEYRSRIAAETEFVSAVVSSELKG
jgi:hypothetical protein